MIWSTKKSKSQNNVNQLIKKNFFKNGTLFQYQSRKMPTTLLRQQKHMAKYKFFGITVFEKEERAIPVPTGTLATPASELLSALHSHGLLNSTGPVVVNNSTALTLSAVWRSINLISSSLAGLPFRHFSESKQGRIVNPNSRVTMLLKFPNEIMTGYIFRESMMANAVGRGNAYAYIQRDAAGNPIELMPILNENCIPLIYKNRLYYKIKIDNEFVVVTSDNILHVPGLSFDGRVGYNPIAIARESIEGALSTQRFGNKFYENGANISGVLEVPGELNDTSYNRLKQSWKEKHEGANNAGSTAILEGGTKFSKIGIPPEEAQFLETREFQITEIARWFGVPPHMLADLKNSTLNNIEHQAMEFVTYTLLPWANRFEEECNRKLVQPSKIGIDYFEHEFNGLLRADSQARGDYYQKMVGIGGLSPNQIAILENMPTFDGGDQRFIQAGYAPLDKIGPFYESKLKKEKTDE